MFLLCCLVAIVHAQQTLSLTLGDMQYAMPRCGVRGLYLNNSFGNATLSVDVMGAAATLALAFDPSQSSCRLCAGTPRYCNASFDADIGLDQEMSWNVKLIALNDQNASYESKSKVAGPLITVAANRMLPYAATTLAQATLCGRRFRYVIILIVGVRAPTSFRFIGVAAAPTLTRIPCSRAPDQAALSCDDAPAFYVVDFTVTNCLAEAPPPPPVPVTQQQSPLFYYYEAFLSDDWPRETLCGESWIALMRRARLELYACSQEAPLYVRPKAWYAAAVVAIAAHRSGQRDTPLWVALDALERTCTWRETDVALDESALANVTRALRVETSPLSEAELCQWLRPLVNGTAIELPYYAQHYWAWFVRDFKYLIPADDSMQAKAVLYIVAPSLLALVTAVGLALTYYHLRRPRVPAPYVTV